VALRREHGSSRGKGSSRIFKLLGRLQAAVLIGAAVFSLASCSEGSHASSGARRGAALNSPDSEWRFNLSRRFGVGDGFRFVFFSLDNESDEPVHIQDIRPYGIEGPRSAAEFKMEIIPRTDEKPGIPWGRYVTYPLRWQEVNGECRSTRTELIDGQRLKPTKAYDAVTVLEVRAVAPGAVSLKGYRIRYQQDGVTFYEDFPLKISFKVSKSASRLPGGEQEIVCSGRRVHFETRSPS
jgi:hypothetical protein